MIKVTRGPCPAVLDGPESAGGKERAALIAYYEESPPRGKRPGFNAYKRKEVGRALREMFGAKCAYCEFPYAAGAPADAEHYRPKSEIERPDGTRISPGYYWLAAEWTNLLPTCIDCNRKRAQTIGGDIRQAGKGIKFPLADESKRATVPDGEAAEEPLLLDPTVDDPDAHLSYGADGFVVAADDGNGPSARGRATIEVLGLYRSGLVTSRLETLYWLEQAMKRFREAAEQLDADPGNDYARRQEESSRDEMDVLAAADKPYSAMVRQRIAAELLA